MANEQNLIPQKKGEPSRNPKGRPKGSFDRITLIRRVLELPVDDLIEPDQQPAWLKKYLKNSPNGQKNLYQAMNARMVLSSINGDTGAYNAITKALGDKLDLTSGGNPINVVIEDVYKDDAGFRVEDAEADDVAENSSGEQSSL